ncbi:IS3 family transposase [Parafrankia discariae]|uniref:IS3 family transposase n=1 Tax=Parafrankia discariae TaxID=365528 RepID=UPI00039F3F28
MKRSVGSAGDCYDSAVTESFFATLECELLDRTTFATHDQARAAISDFIEGFLQPASPPLRQRIPQPSRAQNPLPRVR